MSLLTTCYGADIEALADLDAPEWIASPIALADFVRRQWTLVASALGFSTPLRQALSPLRGADAVTLNTTALSVFSAWHRTRPRALTAQITPEVRATRARVRQQVIEKYPFTRPGRLWQIDEAASDLAGGACFDQGEARLSGRAFLDDSSANFLHPRRSNELPSGCGWQAPVLLSLGTFPWVYGGRLTVSPPGLEWEPAGIYDPASAGMAACASLWQPLVNLRQDARAVVLAFRRFKESVALVAGDVPPYAAVTAAPGKLYRRGLLLHAEQSSPELFTLSTHLGPLAASAHNYVLGRFAAFFSLRRALLQRPAAQRSPAEAQALAENPDPCLAPYLPKDLGVRL